MSDDKIVRVEVFEERARKLGRLPPGGDGGHDGGMPPTDDLTPRVTRIELNLEGLIKSVDSLGRKIDDLTKEVGTLAQRVAKLEGQIAHIPSITAVVLGQIAAAILVAGAVGAAFNYGISAAKPTAPIAAPARPAPQ